MENSTLQEEIRRRNKPSNVRKKKRLEYALQNLKQKKAAAIAAGAMKEDVRQFDKLVKTIKNTPNLSSDKTLKLLKIAKKVRGIKLETRIMNSSSIEKSGPTIDVTATEVKDKKKGDNAQKRSSAIVKRDDKGSTLANRGTRDTEIKPPREPKPYSQKKNKLKGIKGPSKDTINKTVSKIGSAAKTGLSAFTSGYDNQDVKESKTFKQFTELAATSLDEALPLAIPAAIPAIAKTVAVAKAAAPYVATAIGAGGMIYNMSKKNDKVNYPEKPEKPTPKDGESWNSGMTKNGKPVPTRNLSGRYKTYKRNLDKRKNFQDKLTSSSPYSDFSKQPKDTSKTGDNPEARAKIRDAINKFKNKFKNK